MESTGEGIRPVLPASSRATTEQRAHHTFRPPLSSLRLPRHFVQNFLPPTSTSLLGHEWAVLPDKQRLLASREVPVPDTPNDFVAEYGLPASRFQRFPERSSSRGTDGLLEIGRVKSTPALECSGPLIWIGQRHCPLQPPERTVVISYRGRKREWISARFVTFWFLWPNCFRVARRMSEHMRRRWSTRDYGG